jgi:adenylate cyclase
LNEPRPVRRLAAILAADVAGYSRMMGEDEEGTLAALMSDRAAVLDPGVARFGGRLIKTTGDGYLIEFASAVAAIECALAVQGAMNERNRDRAPDRRVEFRIGVNLGEVIVQDDDIFGDGVNVAARLEALAEAGGICVSEKVAAEVRGRVAAGLQDIGFRTLKNIAAPVRVYRVVGPGKDVAPGPEPATVLDKPSIAVLPFDNMSGDPEQSYFSDGITEDVITDLSKVAGLFVIARNSSFAYKGKATNVADVCRELGVRYVLEGSVRKAGNRVRVTAQLIDGPTAGHVWAERYDRDLTDIFAVQDDITRRIVEALAVKLGRSEGKRAGARMPADPRAYEFYLRGRERNWRATKESVAEAKELLLRATEIDPSFAPPFAVLSHAHQLDYVNRWTADPARSLAIAHEFAQKAVALDDTDPICHMALAITHAHRKEFDAALRETERILALDPNFAPGHINLGFSLLWRDRPAEALDAFATAMRLDPHNPDMILHFIARAQFMLGRYDEAIEMLERRIARNPATDVSRVLLAACHGQLGNMDAARAAWADALRVNPEYALEHRRDLLGESEYGRMLAGLRKAGLVG